MLAQIDEALRRQGQPDLEHLEEGQELSSEQASKLQPQLGNQAVQNLLSSLKNASSSFAAVELEEEEEQEELSEQEEDLETEMDLHQVSSGGGGGGAAANPWDVGMLFGGDDDEPEEIAQRRRMRASPSRRTEDTEDPFAEDDRSQLTEADLETVEAALGPPPARDALPRWGDAHYQAVEAALLDPMLLGRRELIPESLVNRSGPLDPIDRALQLGRFLDRLSERTSGLAALLAKPAPVLLTAASGYAGAAARLANLVVCASAAHGGEDETDRALALAMCQDVWPLAMRAAQLAARRGQLHAPVIAAIALGEDPSLPAPRARLPAPSLLGGAALEAILPRSAALAVPSFARPPPPPPPAFDADLAAADATLARFTGGLDPLDPPAPPVLTSQTLQPLFRAANALMNAMGRMQVEAAAAAIAVRRIRPDAPVRSALTHADRALRELARGVLKAGRRLEKLKGRPLHSAAAAATAAAAALQDAASALAALRSWVLSTLAGALDAQLLRDVS